MQIIAQIGNRKLMEREKTLFLCSKRTPIELYKHVFRWTDSLTQKDCIACFNSTELESEVVKALLVARIPVVLFVMNCHTDRNNMQIELALSEKRMLIVVLRRDEPTGKGQTPRLRNEYVMTLCRHVVCGYVDKNGSVFPILAGMKNVDMLIDGEDCTRAAETSHRLERWTVAQDKMLLRMYYEDMGIHAIHKQLKRSYAAVQLRIRAITQPEDMLKGREFEDFVLSLFDLGKDGPLVLEEWQGDKNLGPLKPENNSYPDFVFRYGQEHFALECKWRRELRRDIGRGLFPKRTVERYNTFSAGRGIPVSIVLGVGGEPSWPESLYLVPLEAVGEIVSGHRSVEDFRLERHAIDIGLITKVNGNQ